MRIQIDDSKLNGLGLIESVGLWLDSQLSEPSSAPTTYGLFRTQDDGQYDYEEASSTVLLEAFAQGRGVFIPFSLSNCGDPINCVDGETYEIEYPDDDDDFDPGWGEFDGWGYLIKRSGSSVEVTFVMACDDPTRVDCGCVAEGQSCPFPERMETYLRRFIADG